VTDREALIETLDLRDFPGAGQRLHLMPLSDQQAHQVVPKETCASCGKCSHKAYFSSLTHHRSQCNTDANGLRAAGLKSVPSVYATGMSPARITSS